MISPSIFLFFVSIAAGAEYPPDDQYDQYNPRKSDWHHNHCVHEKSSPNSDKIVDQTETFLVKQVRGVGKPGVSKDTFLKDTPGLLLSLRTVSRDEGVAPVRIDEPISVLFGEPSVFDVLDLLHHVFQYLGMTAGDINLLPGIIL